MVGFDNEYFAADLNPPLTTMELPHAEMGRYAVEELHRLVVVPGSRSVLSCMKLECPLVERASIALVKTSAAFRSDTSELGLGTDG